MNPFNKNPFKAIASFCMGYIFIASILAAILQSRKFVISAIIAIGVLLVCFLLDHIDN